MKGCVSQKNSYIFTDKLYADLDNIQKGCGGRWGKAGGKKTPRVKNMELHAARAHLPAGGCHFLYILNLYCSVLPPLPPPASLSALVTPRPSWLLPGGPHAWFSLLEGCAALCGVSHPRGILHITAPAGPLLIRNILPARKSTSTKDPCFPTPVIGWEKNKIIMIQLP